MRYIRVTRAGWVAPFTEDLVCILDALAGVRRGPCAMTRTEEGKGKGRFGWLTEGSPSRLARLTLSAPPHLSAPLPRCFGVCRILKWTYCDLLDFLPLFSNFNFSERRRFGFPDFCARFFRVLVNAGTLRKVIKRTNLLSSLTIITHRHGFLVFCGSYSQSGFRHHGY